MKMRIDKERDVVRIIIADCPIEESDEVSEGLIRDFDKDNNVVGLEFLNASTMLGDLTTLQERARLKKARVDSSASDYRPCAA